MPGAPGQPLTDRQARTPATALAASAISPGAAVEKRCPISKVFAPNLLLILLVRMLACAGEKEHPLKVFVPGMDICERLPEQAKIANQFYRY